MAAKLVVARVLTEFFDQGEKIAPNALVEGEKEVIEALQKSGTVDADKGAVDYVKSLGAAPVLIIGDGVDLKPETASEPEKPTEGNTEE